MNNLLKKSAVISAIALLSGCAMDGANSFDATPHIQAFNNHVTNATQQLNQASDSIGSKVQSGFAAASNHSTTEPNGKVSVQHGSNSFNSELNTDKDNFHSGTSMSVDGYSASMHGHHSESASGSNTGVSTSMTVPSMNHDGSSTTVGSSAGVSESPAGVISAVAGGSVN